MILLRWQNYIKGNRNKKFTQIRRFATAGRLFCGKSKRAVSPHYFMLRRCAKHIPKCRKENPTRNLLFWGGLGLKTLPAQMLYKGGEDGMTLVKCGKALCLHYAEGKCKADYIDNTGAYGCLSFDKHITAQDLQAPFRPNCHREGTKYVSDKNHTFK